jgi:hypothetical protein
MDKRYFDTATKIGLNGLNWKFCFRCGERFIPTKPTQHPRGSPDYDIVVAWTAHNCMPPRSPIEVQMLKMKINCTY